MLERNSSAETFAPWANSAVLRRYGGRNTNVAISQAIVNSAFSTETRVRPATTGTIWEAEASERLSRWFFRASPLIPFTSASSGGLVRSPRGSRSRRHANGTETAMGSTQHSWMTWASVKPRKSSDAVSGNRRLEASRLRATWMPDRFSARHASSITSAQHAAAVPSTNVAAPTGLPSASCRLVGSSGCGGDHEAAGETRRDRHHEERPPRDHPLTGRPVPRELGDQHGGEAEHGQQGRAASAR